MAEDQRSAHGSRESSLEDIIAGMWEDLFGTRVSVTEDFLSTGGTSLQLVQFLVELEDTFDVELAENVLEVPAFSARQIAHAIKESLSSH